MKTRLAVWLGVELLVASALSTTSCILRRDQVRAWRAWHDNPSSETQAEVERQRRITSWYHVGFAAVLWAGMAVVTVPIVMVVSRPRDRQPTMQPSRKERYSPEAYRRFRRGVFLAIRFGVLWFGVLGTILAFALRGLLHGEDIVGITALLGSLFLFSLFAGIGRLQSLLRKPPNLMPYFKGTVPGCGLLVGFQLLDHSRELDALAQSVSVQPISSYISDDDLFDGRPPIWHPPTDAFTTFDTLLRKFPTHPSVQAARADLEHIRDRLVLAQPSNIQFCLLLRDVHATNGLEWERRQGRY